jgi:hypothetical protein
MERKRLLEKVDSRADTYYSGPEYHHVLFWMGCSEFAL